MAVYRSNDKGGSNGIKPGFPVELQIRVRPMSSVKPHCLRHPQKARKGKVRKIR